MRHNITKFFQQLLVLFLFIGLADPSNQILADSTTPVLDSLNTAAQTAGTLITTIGMSSAQTTQMANMFAALKSNQTAMGGAQGDLNKITMNLATIMMQHQACMASAKKGNADFAGVSVPPGTGAVNCKTVIDRINSINATTERMLAANKQIGCMANLKTAMNQAAQQARAPLSKLQGAADEVWNTYDQIITMNKGIAEKLDKDLNDKDNGYIGKLEKLRALSDDLNNMVNLAGEDGKGGNFQGQLDDLKNERMQGALAWHQMLMSSTQSCFFNDPTRPCSATGGPATAATCIGQELNIASDSPTQKNMNVRNQALLQQLFTENAGKLASIDVPKGKDMKDLNGFLRDEESTFGNIATQLSGTVMAKDFIGNKIDKGAIANFFKGALQECFNSAMVRFKSDMETNGQAKQLLINLQKKEDTLSAQMSSIINKASTQMNKFRTDFTKIYRNDIPQFSANCAVTKDPYKSLDCLKVLGATLKAGIEGTEQRITKSDGTEFVASEGITQINIQNIQLDANGQPVQGLSPVQCKGFDDCLNSMKQSLEAHQQEVTSETQAQGKFVLNANKTFKAVVDGISAKFQEAGQQLVQPSMQEINKELASLGVAGTLKPAEVKVEPLETDEKTKLYKMPKDMKAAFNNSGGYVEMDDPADVSSAMRDRAQSLGENMKEASKKKGLCKVEQKDYKQLKATLPNCDSKSLCSGTKLSGMFNQLEKLFQKTGDDVSEESRTSRGEIVSAFESCLRNVNSELREQDQSDRDTALGEEGAARREAKTEAAKNRAERRKDAAQEKMQCQSNAVGGLAGIGGKARNSTLQNNNDNIVKGLNGITQACAEDDKEQAKSACEELASAVNGAAAPPKEEEIKASKNNTTGTGSNVLQSGK